MPAIKYTKYSKKIEHIYSRIWPSDNLSVLRIFKIEDFNTKKKGNSGVINFFVEKREVILELRKLC